MHRKQVTPRPNSTRLLQSQGLVYAADPVEDDPNIVYWPDDRCYSFNSEEIQLLKTACQDVHDMCCEAADYLVEHPEIMTSKMAIPTWAVKQITESWKRDPSWGSVYGRFDVCFGGLDHPDPRLRVPKFYEYNADTPTSIIESSTIQWRWLEQTGLGNDQWNNLTEDLIRAWKRNLELIEQKIGHRCTVHFGMETGDEWGEDMMNTAVLMDTCELAGWPVKSIFMEQITLGKDGRFYDAQGEHVDVIFKLYPWEWMMEQEFGKPCFENMNKIGQQNEHGEYIGGTIWIEAPYKILWSNKALLPILWELFNDDPRSKWLLETYFENEVPDSLTSYAKKAIFSREGRNCTLKEDGQVISEGEDGCYGAEGYVCQELAMPPVFQDDEGIDHYAVLGLWVVDGKPSGLGVREALRPITANGSIFVPHSISDGPICYKPKPIPGIDEINSVLEQGAQLRGDMDEVRGQNKRKRKLSVQQVDELPKAPRLRMGSISVVIAG